MKIASLPNAAIKNLRTLLKTEASTPDQELLVGDEGDEPLVVITWGRYRELLQNTRLVPARSPYTIPAISTLPLPPMTLPWATPGGSSWSATNTDVSYNATSGADDPISARIYKVE